MSTPSSSLGSLHHETNAHCAYLHRALRWTQVFLSPTNSRLLARRAHGGLPQAPGCRVLRLVHIGIRTAPGPHQGCSTRTYAILRGGSTDDCLCVRCTLVESYDGPPRTVYVNHTDHSSTRERVRVSYVWLAPPSYTKTGV